MKVFSHYVKQLKESDPELHAKVSTSDHASKVWDACLEENGVTAFIGQAEITRKEAMERYIEHLENSSARDWSLGMVIDKYLEEVKNNKIVNYGVSFLAQDAYSIIKDYINFKSKVHALLNGLEKTAEIDSFIADNFQKDAYDGIFNTKTTEELQSDLERNKYGC